MLKNYFQEKITLIISFLILNNYFLLVFNFSELIIKINFFLFLVSLTLFYFYEFNKNLYLKIFFLLIVLISLGTPTFEWDTRSIWLFHGKRIFYDNSIFSIVDNYAPFSHNAYPLLVPALASSLAKFIGHWNEVFPKLAFTFMFLPPLIITYVFLKGARYLIFLSIVLFIIGKYLFNGWADGLIALYFGISSFLMYLTIIKSDKSVKGKKIFYFISFCFFIFLTLIKNEGAALLFILFVTTLLIKIYKKELKNNILEIAFFSLSFLPIIFWKLFCLKNGLGNDYINTNIFLNLAPRITDLENYKQIAYFLLLNEKFLFALFFFSLTFWFVKDKDLFIFIFGLVFLYIVILFFIFLSTPYDLYFQLDSTAARVSKTLSFTLAFFGLYNLRDRIKN